MKKVVDYILGLIKPNFENQSKGILKAFTDSRQKLVSLNESILDNNSKLSHKIQRLNSKIGSQHEVFAANSKVINNINKFLND